MKCQLCGRDAKIVQKFDCDGIEKTVAYCERCAKKVIRDAKEIYKPGLILMVKHSELVQDSILSYKFEHYGSHVNSFVMMPVIVQTMLFKVEDTDDWSRKEMYRREIAILKEKLKRAVEKEDYKTASLIKRRIQKLEEILNK